MRFRLLRFWLLGALLTLSTALHAELTIEITKGQGDAVPDGRGHHPFALKETVRQASGILGKTSFQQRGS